MKTNTGVADRLFRILIAVAIVVLYFAKIITGTWAYILLAVAVVLVITALIGVCPLYSVMGINSCKTKKV